MKRILFLATALLVTPVHAEPDEVMRRVINSYASTLDVGLLRTELDMDRSFRNSARWQNHLITNGSSYEYSSNTIWLWVSSARSDISPESEHRNVCAELISYVRLFANIDPDTGKTRGQASFFAANFFNKGNFDLDDFDAVLQTMKVAASIGDVTCTGKLASNEIDYEDAE